jgi:hypothetical protein
MGIYENTLAKTKTISPLDLELAEPNTRDLILQRFNQTIEQKPK